MRLCKGSWMMSTVDESVWRQLNDVNCWWDCVKVVEWCQLLSRLLMMVRLFWSSSSCSSSTTSLDSRLQWFSQLDGIHQQKDAKYSLQCLFKKFFNWLRYFLWTCILLHPKNTHTGTVCTQWPQTFFLFICLHMNIKNTQILSWFQIRWNNWKKVHSTLASY
jgi:hypothetical protein